MQARIGEPEGGYHCLEVPDDEPTPQAVAALPAQYCLVLKLHYFEELSYEEIAARHYLLLGTVKAQLHRGHDLLQRRLARERLALLGDA